MKKMIILLLVALVALSTITFVACENKENEYTPEYNAVLYDSAVEWIREDFQNENFIKHVGFIDDDSENELPTTRTFLITDNVSFENMFVDDFTGFEIDFDNEMLIVYTFAIEYVLPAKITKMALMEKTLTINYKINQISGTGSAVRPFQRWFVVKLDKLDISNAMFVENK